MNDGQIQVVDRPDTYRPARYLGLRTALLNAPLGKAVRVPLDFFNQQTPESALRMKRNCGRRLHMRRLPDGIYLWLDPPPENGTAA